MGDFDFDPGIDPSTVAYNTQVDYYRATVGRETTHLIVTPGPLATATPPHFSDLATDLDDFLLSPTPRTREDIVMSSETKPRNKARSAGSKPHEDPCERLRDWSPPAALAAMRQSHQHGRSLRPGLRTHRGATYRVGRMGGEDDLFHHASRDAYLCWTFAVMASHPSVFFFVPTAYPDRASDFFATVEDLGPLAAGRYEKDLRARFAANKWSYREGYSLPLPPTPALRYLYDTASRYEARAFPGQPRREDHDGTAGVHARAARDAARLRATHAARVQAVDVDAMTSEEQVRYECKRLRPDGPGFSAGELHWGPWPLANAVIVLDKGTTHAASLNGKPLPAPTGPASVCPNWRACAAGLPYLSPESVNGVDILFQHPNPKGK